MKIFTTVILLTTLARPLEAQWLERRTPGIPRTADGKPNLNVQAPRTADGKLDLTGLWQVISPDGAVGNVALRKPGDLQPADIQPWAQTLVQQRSENFGVDNPRYKCLPDGPNYSTGGGMKRILQTPAMIAILQEDLTYRPIHMDGRALEKDPNPSWMGYSVGHWEGDTLVVESNGYNDRTWLLGGYAHTEALRMTERVRRPRTVEVTFSDGKLFVSLNGGPKQPVVPQSETNFSGTGLSYQFIRDGNGIATDLVEGHISGDFWRLQVCTRELTSDNCVGNGGR